MYVQQRISELLTAYGWTKYKLSKVSGLSPLTIRNALSSINRILEEIIFLKEKGLIAN